MHLFDRKLNLHQDSTKISSKYMYIFLYLIALKETDFFYVLCVVPGNTQSPLIRHCVCRRGGVGEPLAISSHCLLKSLAYKSNVSFLSPQEQ